MPAPAHPRPPESRLRPVPSARPVLVRLHRRVGLAFGLLLASQGLTGSILVFQRQIDRVLNPALFRASGPADPALGFTAVQHLAEAATGQPAGTIRPPDAVWPVWVVQPERGQPGARTAYLDPATGAVLGLRDVSTSFVAVTHQLHEALLLRPWGGHEAVGVLGLVLLGMAASGLGLWWPRANALRALVTLRHRPALLLNLDLHRLAGGWTALVLLVLAFSGTVLVFRSWFGPPAGPAAPATRSAAAPRREPMRMDADSAVAAARAYLPGQVVAGVIPPSGRRPVWTVALRPEGSDPEIRRRTEITLDPWSGPWSGVVLEERGPRTRSAMEEAIALQRWVHGGTLFGWPGRIAALLAGLALPTLLATGLAAWLLRRRRRRRAASLYGEPA
ncbi:MAG TPA: PepSY-associated TM helix domain-containing protein [Crenalkalicoccus sp.]|nr:PepSY-associated TM helix domain-containing protein [Crenalkalicoccus sp.]